MKYIPSTKKEQEAMLKEIGVSSFEQLISYIPKHLRDDRLNMGKGQSEYELLKDVRAMSAINLTTADVVSFMGGGIYDHFIPAAVKHIALRPEFYTAYTPYQAEVSQGTLQVIYEFQSMICELYSMEISNASMYDVSTATAEACHMAISLKKKDKVLVSGGLHPAVREVMHTYLKGQEIEIADVPLKEGTVDIDQLKKHLTGDASAFVLQTPNFFGNIEETERIGNIVKENNAIFIVSQNPMSLGVLEAPGNLGADIALGEGQVLGIHQACGGPLLGLFTSKKQFARNMPGRIIGKTEDSQGRPGYVMTLQTREQHIRREKATSNICTNEGLCMLMSTAYMSLLGKQGFMQVSKDSFLSAHYLRKNLEGMKGVSFPFSDKPFFNEFTVKIEGIEKKYNEIKKQGYLPGVLLSGFGKEYKDMIILASTEKRSREQIDGFIDCLKGVI